MIELAIDTRGAEALLRVGARQVPFVISKAINDTAKDFQQAQVRRIFDVFTIRRATFAARSVKIKPFASKAKLEARVQIEPPGGIARADIFAKFETRHEKRPRTGRHLAIPVQVGRTKTGIVGRGQRPKRVLQTRHAFILRRQHGKLVPGIYRRTGTDRRSVQLVYRLKPSVPIDDRLQFIDTALGVVRSKYTIHFARAWRFALRTAR